MVSIIVGIYNVILFLQEKRLSCIFSQTYSNWELILVDDGSTDGSGDFCEKLAIQDTRIRVLHKTNGGLSSARNTGLNAAKGEYVWFYDVDDEAHPDLLEYSVREMELRNIDMLQFSFRAITPSLKLEEEVVLSECMIDNQDKLRECYLDYILFIKYGNGFAWNKVLRRSFIEKYNLRYDNLLIQQDEVFNLSTYPLIQKVYLSPIILYDYYIYEKGNTRSRFIPNRFDIYVSVRDKFESLRNEWKITDFRYDDYLQKRFFLSLDQAIRFNLLHTKCPWNKKEKDLEMKRVLNHPYTKQALDWAKIHFHNTEIKMYLHAYTCKSLSLLYAYDFVFSLLKKIFRAFKNNRFFHISGHVA